MGLLPFLRTSVRITAVKLHNFPSWSGKCGSDYGKLHEAFLVKRIRYGVINGSIRLYCSDKSTPAPGKSDGLGVPKLRPKVKPKQADWKPAHYDLPADGKRHITEQMLQESYIEGTPPMPFHQKFKSVVRTTWYSLILVFGACIILTILGVIVIELFYKDSPNVIYGDSFNLVKANTEVRDAVGEPMKARGKDSGRGWRRQTLHKQFVEGEKKYIRMRYFIQGMYRTGTVDLEKFSNDLTGNYVHYSYIIVTLDGYPPKQILVVSDTDVETDEVPTPALQ